MTNSPTKIAPSILAADFTRLREQIAAAERAGADWIHIDVMDGQFVPNITMGPFIVEAVRRITQLPLDVHLMIIEPDHLLKPFADAGASRITVHWETCPHLHRTLSAIKALGCKTGVAINPHTPVEFLRDILPEVDLILIMTVNPGFGGQSFIETTLAKIRQARRMISESGRQIEIQVDGGINELTVKRVVEAGASVLVVGTAVFSDSFSVQQGFDALRASLAQ